MTPNPESTAARRASRAPAVLALAWIAALATLACLTANPPPIAPEQFLRSSTTLVVTGKIATATDGTQSLVVEGEALRGSPPSNSIPITGQNPLRWRDKAGIFPLELAADGKMYRVAARQDGSESRDAYPLNDATLARVRHILKPAAGAP